MFSQLRLLFLHLILSFFFISAYKHENDIRRKRSDDDCSNRYFKQDVRLCQKANLKMIPFTDSEKKSITVSFNLIDSVKFKDCFEYYDIFLLNNLTGHTSKEYKLYAGSFPRENLSYTFEDVLPGLYEIDIQPCYTKECCANLTIFHEDLNITDYDLLRYTSEEPPKDNSVVTYVVLVTVVGIILIIFGLYCFRSSLRNVNVTENVSVRENSVPQKVAIYIFHHYDEIGINKQKANILKDFLIKSSLYDSVKTIEDELYQILFNVHKWLINVLKERNNDGIVQKIILIDSEDIDEDGSIENIIFDDFTAMLNDNIIKCLSSYDNLFVVQIRGISGNSEKFRNLVRRHRHYIPKHLIELCLNLYSVSDSNVPELKKRLQEILMQHPIRNLN